MGERKMITIWNELISRKPTPTWIGLFLLLVLGLVLRLWGITFDLPYITSSREHLEVGRALELAMGQFNFGRIVKGGLFYLLFAEYSVFFVVLWLLGIVESPHDFANFYMRDVSPFWIIGRLTSVLMGVVSVFLVYLLGKKIYDYRTGLLSALFFALYPVHINTSHYILVDIPMVMLSIASFYAIVLMAETGKMKHYIMAGLLIGLAAVNKIPAVLLSIPFILIHFFRLHGEHVPVSKWLDKRIMIGLLTLGTIYIVGAPGILLYPSKLIGVMNQITQGQTSSGAYSGETPNLWLTYLIKLYKSLGAPLFIFFIWGMVRSIYKSSYIEKGMFAFCVIFYVGFCITSFKEWSIYYLLPIIPFGLILAARAIFLTSEALSRQRLEKGVVQWVLVLLTTIPLAYMGIAEARGFGRPNSQLIAKNWIENNIKPGSKILLHGFPGLSYTQSVPIRDLPENLLRMANEAEDKGKKVKATYLRMQGSLQEDLAYNLVSVHTRRILWESPQYYRDQQIEYIVLNKKYFDAQEDIQYSKKTNRRRMDFYQQLKSDPKVTLLKRFDPLEMKARGPLLELHKIR